MNTIANNTPTTSEITAAKAVEAFYLRAGERGTAVSLWINQVTTKGAPDFDGKIGEQRVALRIRHTPNGNFLAVTRGLKQEEIGENGFKEEQVGSANIVVNDRGIPVLAIKLGANPDKTVWANISLKAPLELLVACGLNLDILTQKKSDYAARKAAKERGPVASQEKEAVPA